MDVSPVNWVIYLTFTVAFALVFAFLINVQEVDYVFMILVSLTIQVHTPPLLSKATGLFVYVLTTKTELTYQGASVFIFGALLVTLEIFLAFTRISFFHIILVTVATVIWG